MRKRVSILVALAFCISAFGFVAPVSAGHLANNCDIGGSTTKNIGNSSNPAGTARGVMGTIDALGASYHLSSQGINAQCGLTEDQLFTYIGLESLDTTSPYQFGDFARVGILRCNYTVDSFSYCTDNGEDAYWVFERRGCGYAAQKENLGAADFNATEFQVYVYNGTLYVKIDGVVEYSTTVSSSERLSCWLDESEDVRVTARGEFLDGGDQLAVSSDKLNFDNVAYVNVNGSTWLNPDFGSPCDRIDSSGELAGNCTINNGQDFDIWQTPN